MKKRLILPLILSTLSLHTMAQEKPIDELFSVMAMEKQMAGGFEAMLPVIDQMTAKFKLDSKGKAELKEIFRTWYNEDIDRTKMINEMKKLYSQAFTADELSEIISFYKTPIGQKFLETSPKLMQLGAQIGMQEAQSKQVKLMERVQPFLEKHGIKR
ncbi:DUF2059 domain-containing protein [Thalassotalea hakodatensis]|uniref:DUF2059 domain-containing protein n=1 Tax=Thalassotalea hakodatensis TaxID=3030492 RepID=UPI0025729EC8|nr:DUF2059 domain-containing protein [Thalassotalea hakodatensis]